MLVIETARVRTFSGRFDLDEANKRFADNDGKVRTRLDIGERRLADQLDRPDSEPADLRQVLYESFQRTAQLVLRRPGYCDVRQFGLEACAISRDRICQ